MLSYVFTHLQRIKLLKFKIFSCLCFVGLCLVPNSSAEILKLKSGVFFEVKLLETKEHSFLTKTSFGKEKEYFFDRIETINEMKPEKFVAFVEGEGSSNRLDKFFIPKEIALEDRWNVWQEKISRYHHGMEGIMSAVDSGFRETKQKTVKLNDDKKIVKMIQEYQQEVKKHLKTLKRIKPPKEFYYYHKNITECVSLMDQAQDKFIKYEFDEFHKLIKESRLAYFRAFKDSKSLFVYYGAPEEIILEMDLILSRYNDPQQTKIQ